MPKTSSNTTSRTTPNVTSNRMFPWLMVGLVSVLCLGIFLINYKLLPWQNDADNGEGLAVMDDGIETKTKKPERKMIPPNRQWVGGVPRPKTDMVDGTSYQKANYPNPRDRIGVVPLVSPGLNKSTQLVAEASRSGKSPERLSIFANPKPFNLKEFESNPSAYIENIEPGRIMQTTRIGPDATPIQRDGNYFSAILQGETITLKAKVNPLMPVTFYSPHVGHFQNSLSTITVRADDSGLAEAQYTAAKGTIGDIDILASSPVHSHQAKYLVRVEIPEALPKLAK